MRTNTFAVIYFFISTFSVTAAEEIIKRKNYTLSYNEDHEVANWVSYEMDHRKLQNCVKRKNSFKEDPLVSTGSATHNDYRGSGFDRGHLVPAGDMKFTKEAMSDTFYFSNMTPQPAQFNQGLWAQLETLMRAWALKYHKIWIVTGPVLKENLPVIGNRNLISIPEAYFKVILKKVGNKYQGIGFLMNTNVPHNELRSYVTSIRHIEDLTNLDFFQFLDERIKDETEETVNISQWNFKESFAYLPCQASVAQQ